MRAVIFRHQIVREPVRYYLYREERAQLRGMLTQNKITAAVTVEYLKNKIGEEVFVVSVSDYRQSNNEGMYKWVRDMIPLRSKVVFTIGEDGALGKIRNHSEISNTFAAITPGIIKQRGEDQQSINMADAMSEVVYDADKLASAWRYTAPYVNLFAGIHGKEFGKDEDVQGFRLLPNFIGIKEVPVNTKETLLREDRLDNPHYEIGVEGVLAQDKIDQDKMSSLVRLLRNHPRAITDLTLRYNEHHLLDKYHWTVQSTCMSLVVIPSLLYRQETTIIKRI